MVSVDGLHVVFQGGGHLEVGWAEVALDPDRVLLPVLGEQPHTAKAHAALQTLALLLVQTQGVHVADCPVAVSASKKICGLLFLFFILNNC